MIHFPPVRYLRGRSFAAGATSGKTAEPTHPRPGSAATVLPGIGPRSLGLRAAHGAAGAETGTDQDAMRPQVARLVENVRAKVKWLREGSRQRQQSSMERRGQGPPEGVLWDCYGKWDSAGEDFF
jgi:hypothetical protein